MNEKELIAMLGQVTTNKVAPRKNTKPVIYFDGKEKGLVCNKTNWSRIQDILKEQDSDDWIGKSIELGAEPVEFQGKTNPALRVQFPMAAATTSGDEVPF